MLHLTQDELLLNKLMDNGYTNFNDNFLLAQVKYFSPTYTSISIYSQNQLNFHSNELKYDYTPVVC